MSKNKKLIEFENSNSTPIQNIPLLREWIDSCYHDATTSKNKEKSYKILEEVSKIFRNNKKFLLNKLGKQDFCTKDSANRRLYCWQFNIESLGVFWIITAPERGSSIEVDILDDKEEEFCLLFKEKIRQILELELI
tara:strand:+ start:469 stop:876 length:408 start_codon:yes stop_codon:yes gene_type:complete